VYLEPPDSRLYRFTLHLAVPSVPARADGFPDNHQVAPALAECLEAGLVGAQRRSCRRYRDLCDLGRVRRCVLRREATERFTDDAAALAWPDPRAMMLTMPLLPSIRARVRAGKREIRASLTLAVQNKVQGVVRVDAATIARAVGRDLGHGVAVAVAAVRLRLAEDEHGRAFEHLAACRHRVRRGGATLLDNGGAVAGGRDRRR